MLGLVTYIGVIGSASKDAQSPSSHPLNPKPLAPNFSKQSSRFRRPGPKYKCNYISNNFLAVRVTIIVISEQSPKPGVRGIPLLTTSTPTQFWRRHWCLSVTSIPSTVPRDTVTSRDVATKGEFLEIKMMMANACSLV